jgi:RNA polymerase sigma-70 factor (ECF subfamily)
MRNFGDCCVFSTCQSSGRMDEAQSVEAWIFTIARRTVADFYRHRNRRPVLETSDVKPVADSVSPDVLLGADSDHSVHEEVLSWLLPMAHLLPLMYAEPLIRVDFQVQSQQQVADAVGLSLSGAKSRVQRARVMLGEVLRACCDVDFGPDGRAKSFERTHAR